MEGETPRVIPAGLTKEEAKTLHAAFMRLDADHNGSISPLELSFAMRTFLRMEKTEEECRTLMKEFDTSGDGNLQWDEFLILVQTLKEREALRQQKAEQQEKFGLRSVVADLLQEMGVQELENKEKEKREKAQSILPLGLRGMTTAELSNAFQ